MTDVFSGFSSSLRKFHADEFFTPIGVFTIVVGVGMFLWLVLAVTDGASQHFDERVIRALRAPNDASVLWGPAWFQEVARDMTALGGYAVLVLLVAIAAGFLRLDGRTSAARFLLIAVISGFLVTLGLKALISRPRPTVVPYLSQAFQTSFPSGHAMMSTVVYLTLGALLSRFASNRPRLRVYFLAVALVISGLVGASRVYLGVHYPTDVLAGWAAGLVWATLCSLIAKQLQRRGLIEIGL